MTDTPLVSMTRLLAGMAVRMRFAAEPGAFSAHVFSVRHAGACFNRIRLGHESVPGIYFYSSDVLLDPGKVRVWIMSVPCPKRVRKDGPLC